MLSSQPIHPRLYSRDHDIIFIIQKQQLSPATGDASAASASRYHRAQDVSRIKTGAAEMAQDRIEIDTGTSELLCEIRDRVALITLNRPEARNALSDRLTPALRRMIRQCGDDPGVGALLITGAGNAFCAGGDVKGMGSNAAKAEITFDQRVADLRAKQRTLTGALVAVRKPTIAALPGPAAGAGLALALACDIRIAAESAIMATGYVRIGLTGDYGIAWLLTRLVGTSRARELMFLSERIDARRCETLGLVNRVVPDAELPETAFALARSLADGPSIALASMKDNLDHAVTADFLQSLDQEAENMVRAARTADHKEAVQAFIGKRKPIFSGR
jgi:enoyl-CoA hydratase/carnithine racemase